jgi:putative sigma-54 modulation protein
MQFVIHGKNMEISDWMKSYVEKKLGKLDRYLPIIDETRVELSVEKTKSANHSQVCQVTVHSKGAILRAEERAGDMRDAIDTVVDKMYRQIARYKGKRWNRGRPSAGAEFTGEPLPLVEADAEDEDEAAEYIVRRKRFVANPMDEDEAIQQMELLGHDFFVFYNVDAAGLNVVYKRRDGQYGLLQPDIA